MGRTVGSDFRWNFQGEDSRPHSRLLPWPGTASGPEHSTSHGLCQQPRLPQVTQSRIKVPADASVIRRAGQQAGPVPSAHAGAQECPALLTTPLCPMRNPKVVWPGPPGPMKGLLPEWQREPGATLTPLPSD